MILLIRFLVLWGINVLALIVVDWMFSGVTIGRWGSLILGAFVLTVGNAFLKPILAILTLPLIIVTFGLAYFALNVLILGLVRPEGVFFGLLMLASVVLSLGWSASRKLLGIFALVFGVPGAAYFFWRWSYFGYPLPNPYYIKGRGTIYPRRAVNGAQREQRGLEPEAAQRDAARSAARARDPARPRCGTRGTRSRARARRAG